MKMVIKRLFREPLVHFLLIGVAIFAFYDLTNEQGSQAPNQIFVNNSQLQKLTANFKRTWMRPPNEEELAALVNKYVREEIFYREALSMGLDQNDAIVRRRMHMKLEYILDDLSSEDVTDEQLVLFLQGHQNMFISEGKVSFQQVFLDPDKRINLAGLVTTLLTRLNDGEVSDSKAQLLGDPTLMPSDVSLATQYVITRSFGEEFAKEVIKLTPSNWVGPIYSTYGAHLIKVSKRENERTPELAEIRDLVKDEYLAQQRKRQKELMYQQLREGYEVIIEDLNKYAANNEKTNGEEIIVTARADER